MVDQRTEMARAYARDFGMEAQREDEPDGAFVRRVVEDLHVAGRAIEAHEVNAGGRVDRSPTAMLGVAGHVGLALNGGFEDVRGDDRVGLEIAAGAVATREQQDPLMVLMQVFLAGSDR